MLCLRCRYFILNILKWNICSTEDAKSGGTCTTDLATRDNTFQIYTYLPARKMVKFYQLYSLEPSALQVAIFYAQNIEYSVPSLYCHSIYRHLRISPLHDAEPISTHVKKPRYNATLAYRHPPSHSRNKMLIYHYNSLDIPPVHRVSQLSQLSHNF